MSGALETVLSRPKTVLTMMLVLVMGGIMSYIGIPKEANPDIDVPVFYVSIGQQGLSPEDGVRLIARPMETELRSLDGLKEITTIAAEGHVGVLLEFTVDFDKDEALADIRDKVDAAQAEIPEEADEPRIIETNFALQPTIIVTLSGDVPERTLHRHAQLLSDEIEAISTVLDANLSGNRDEMLEVVIDQMRLESYDISQDELVDAVTQNNQLVAAGFLDTGNGRFNVKVPGLFETVNDISSLPIKVSGDGVVTLGDVADLRRTFEDPNTYTRVNGEPAISIQVRKRIGTNIIANNADVVETVNSFTADWPDAIKVGLMLDQSSFIFEVLGNLEAAILTAIALVMIVVVAALGMRSGILVGLAIPTSFLVGFLILSVLGMTVNMMVMFGMVLTVGILVDGAIVITEYADRKMSEGLERSEAYKRAAKLMLWPIVSSTATTLAAFLPMLLWPGVPGEFMSYLPIMVIIVLSAALMTAMVFLPTLGIVLGDTLDGIGHHAIKIGLLVGFGIGAFGAHMSLQNGSATALAGVLPPPAIYMLGGIAGMLMLAAVTALIRFVAGRNRAYDDDKTVEPALTEDGRFNMKSVKGFSGLYIRLLQPAVKSVIGSVLVVGAVVFVAFSVLQAFTANNNGVEFFVEEEPDLAIVLVSGRGNMSALENRDLMIQVERELLKVEGISNVILTSGKEVGGGQQEGVQDAPPDQIGSANLELAPFCCRRMAAEIFEEIRDRTSTIPGIKVEVRKVEGGPPTGKDLRLQITSDNYDELIEATARVRNFVEFEMADLRDFEDTRPLPGIEWKLDVDREEAGRFGTDVSTVGSIIQLVTNGVLVGKYRPDDSEEEVEIRARLPEGERSIDQLDQLKVRTPNGQVPIRNFIDREPQPKVSSITRRDGRYAMDVKANLIQGVAATPDEKVQELDAWLKDQSWPQGIQFRFRGADEEQKESGEFLMRAMFGSLFLMFIILLTQFNSFYQTFLTLATVVLSVFGVLLGMMLTGQKFSIIMTGTGIVALAGIVVNNAIVLMDTYNRFTREEKMDQIDAILRAAGQRLRPILLTTVTTILGLVPMATQVNLNFFEQQVMVGGITSIWWVQLSTAIIFGLAFSTVLTLFLIPATLALPILVVRRYKGVGNFVERRRERRNEIRLARRQAKEAKTVEPDAEPSEPEEIPVYGPQPPLREAAE